MMRRLTAVAAALVAPFLTAGTAAPPPPIAIEALAELPFITDPALSPDGRKVAARVTIEGKESIAIMDVPHVPGKGSRLIPITDAALRSYSWAGSDRLMIGVRTVQVVLGIPLPFTRLFRFELSTGKMIPVGDSSGFLGDEIIFTDPAGRYILMAAQDHLLASPRVDRVSLDDGSAVEVQERKEGIWDWFADSSGVIRAGVDYGERGAKIYYRAAAGEKLRRVDTTKYVDDDTVIDSIRLVTDTSKGIVISNAKTGRFAVYEYDFAADTVGTTVFEHPTVDVTSVIQGENGRIEGVNYVDDRPRVKWLNPELETLQASIDRALPDRFNVMSGRSADGNIVLIWSGGAHDPGTFFVFDRKAKRMDAFASPYDRLDGAQFAEVRSVSYRARDGLEIPAYLTLPKGRPGKDLPLIVFPHGGPFYRDTWSFDPSVQLLANRGYAVLQPNFRGSTGYGRQFVERGAGQWGTGMIDDMDDGVDWLVRQGIVDPKRVCIMGYSYGGYAAMWAPIRSPERYRCAISMAGVSDVRAMLKYDSRSAVPRRYVKQWKQRVEGEEKQDLAAISPLQQAARQKVPLLIVHGEEDNNVPPSQSHDMVKALKKNGAVFESAFYPDAGHSFYKSEDSVDFFRKVEAFLAKHNPAAPAKNEEAVSPGAPAAR